MIASYECAQITVFPSDLVGQSRIHVEQFEALFLGRCAPYFGQFSP